MKKYVAIVACVALLSLVSHSAFAESDEMMPEKRQEIRLERTEKRQERQENRMERREERQTVRQEKRDARADKHASRLSERFAKYAKHLETMITRVEGFIAKKKEAGVNVSASEALIAQAKTSLASAVTLGEEAVAEFQSIEATEYTTQRDIALGAAKTAQEARTAFKATKDLIVEAIKLLKNNE